MSDDLTRNQQLFVQAIADAARTQQRPKSKSSVKRGCPQWLAEKYRAFRPQYEFDVYTTSGADLEEIRMHSTGEYVGVYFNHVKIVGNEQKRWVERYVWVWRNNRMVEVTQIGVDHGWRQLKRGAIQIQGR